MSNKSSTNIGIIDRSLTLTGSSQKLMSQNMTRGALFIQNVGNANIGIAFGTLTEDGSDGPATASIAAAGTYTIVPTGTWTMGDGGFINCGAIYVIGTASQAVSAFESN